MTVHVPDRFKAANAFWIGLAKIGLTPAAVLSQARLPLTIYDGRKNLVRTAQFFALWRAVGELSADPAAGLKIATQIDVGNRPPSTSERGGMRSSCTRPISIGHSLPGMPSCLTC